MAKKKIANIPFGPYITVLAGATVNGKPNYATLGAYGVDKSAVFASFYDEAGNAPLIKECPVNYRYAFSKNMVGKIQHTFVTDKVNDLESYRFWKVQLVYKF